MNAQDPKVAIVVRTKDRPKFLERALASISSQTMTEWEAVVINDGGNRDDVEAVIAHLREDHRAKVRALHSDESWGRWVSANSGVLATSAELIVLHDDDDTWHPSFLELATDYLSAHPERGGVVSRIEIVWEQQIGDRLEVTGREVFQAHLHAPTLKDTMLFNRFVPIGFVYRRRLHETLGLYDDRLPVIGDWEFNLRVLAAGPLDYLGDTPFAFWHQRTDATGFDGNSVITASRQHEKFDALVRDQALRDYVEKHGDGLVLYLTKFIDERFCQVEARLANETRQVGREVRRFRPVYRLRENISRLLQRRK